MGDLDPKTLDAGWRRYFALRRRHRRFMLGLLCFSVAFMVFVDLLDLIEDRFKVQTKSVTHYLLSVPAVLLWTGAFACIGGLFITHFSLCITQFSLFPYCCPRCGKWFAAFGWRSMFTDRCRHCGLDLGPAAMATPKPLQEKPEPLSQKAGIWDRELDGTP